MKMGVALRLGLTAALVPTVALAFERASVDPDHAAASSAASSSAPPPPPPSSLPVDEWAKLYRNWTYYPTWAIPPSCLDKDTCPRVKKNFTDIAQAWRVPGDAEWRMTYTFFDGVWAALNQPSPLPPHSPDCSFSSLSLVHLQETISGIMCECPYR